jgi:hypothetical protein
MPTVAWILDLTLLMAFENSSERVMVSGCFKNGMMGMEITPPSESRDEEFYSSTITEKEVESEFLMNIVTA